MSRSARPIFALFAAAGILALGAQALQAAPALQTKPAEAAVTVPAGGEAEVAVQAFCLNFGEPFPKAVTVSSESAPAGVVQVMKAAAHGGALDVLQTQIAIWHQIEGAWGYKDKDVDLTTAKALVAAAVSETAGALMERGVALDAAIRDGRASATIDGWQVTDAPKALPSDAPYHGTGTLRVKNLTSDTLTVRVPLGLVLKAADAAEQDMGVYAVEQVTETPSALPKTGFGPMAPHGGGAGRWIALVLGAAVAVTLGRRLRRSATAA